MKGLLNLDKTCLRKDWGGIWYYQIRSTAGRTYPFGWSPDSFDASQGFRLCREIR
jgi:hypothetical protein